MADPDRVGDRYRKLDELPGSRSVHRWLGADDDGVPVEVIRPITSGSAAPGRVRADFARAHRAVRGGSDPALVQVHEVVETARAVDVVRAPLDRATLADVDGTLSGDTIAAIGARLFPAVLEVGGDLGGAILLQDVGLDSDGWVVLAPLGPHTSHVARSVAGAAAPEIFEGAEPDGRAALYSLGNLLYRLATGRNPPTGAAPSAPSTWNHRVSPGLDRAILRLLDPDPDRRPAALPDLQSAAGRPEDLRPLTRRARQPQTGTQRTATSRARKVTGQPISVPHDALAGLDPSARSLAAGMAGVPLGAVDELIRSGLPLVLARDSAAASSPLLRTARSDLSEQVHVPRAPALGPLAWLFLGLVGAGVPLAIGLALIPVLGLIPTAIGTAVGTSVGGLAAWRAIRNASRASEARDAETSWALQEKGREERSRWPQLASIDQRIARMRIDLAKADLPAAADADVRDALKEIEHRIDAIVPVLQTAERALGAVDRARLSTRLQNLEGNADPRLAEARDRAARTAADLADVEARRDRQLAELQQIEGVLDELASALAPQDHEPAEAVIRRAAQTAQLLRARGLSQ